MPLHALVGEVWPHRREGLAFGSDLVVHVVHGCVEVGEVVEVPVGPGRTVQAAVTSVAASDPAAAFVKARIALPGRPPGPGARLEVRLGDVAPSDVLLMGTLASATPAPAASPACPWAAVFSAIERFEDGLVLLGLLEEDIALLANEEPPDYFLGCLCSERAVAAVVADRMRALFGGGDDEWSAGQFLRGTHGALAVTAEDRASFVERLRVAGVALSAPE
jgi:hypothetical protein